MDNVNKNMLLILPAKVASSPFSVGLHSEDGIGGKAKKCLRQSSRSEVRSDNTNIIPLNNVGNRRRRSCDNNQTRLNKLKELIRQTVGIVEI
jgi:hypothetical protein